jgi:hypothetical protein
LSVHDFQWQIKLCLKDLYNLFVPFGLAGSIVEEEELPGPGTTFSAAMI